MKTKAFLLLSLLLAGAVSARAGGAVTARTDAFRLDLRPSPRKVEPGDGETLAFSSRWADPSTEAASVEITLDGARHLTLPSGEGMFDWTPNRGGLFTFTHTARDANGLALGDVYEASFIVENFSFVDGDIVAEGYEGIYDGEGHSISVSSSVIGAGVKYATAQGGPYSATKPTRTDAGTETVWFVVEAPFYLPVTNSAMVAIAKRPLAVTAEPKSKVYGEADPALTWTAEGLVAGESLTGALTREAGEAVGTYAINQGTLAATANYALSFTGADFTIVPGVEIHGTRVRQRYPWNGLVDVEFDVDAPQGKPYLVTLSARNMTTGDELLVATAWLDGSAETNATVSVEKGSHRLVWDAGHDLGGGFLAEQVEISLSACFPGDETALPVVSDGLLACWPFNGNWTDTSGAGHDVAIGQGTELWGDDRAGTPASAAAFDERSSAGFGERTPATATNDWTVAFWARPEAELYSGFSETVSGMPNYRKKIPLVTMAQHGGSGNHAGAGIAVGTNGIAVLEHANMLWATPLVWYENMEGGWSHVAVTMNGGGSPVLYVNGVKVREGLASSRFIAVTIPQSDHDGIGGEYGGSGNNASYRSNYKGSVDDLLFYGRALSALEIAAIASASPIRKTAIGGASLASFAFDPISIDTMPQPRSPRSEEKIEFSLTWGDGNAAELSVNGETISPNVADGNWTWSTASLPDGLYEWRHVSGSETLRATFLKGSMVPQSVAASDGTSEECVEVTWTPVAGMTHEVWRGEENASFADAEKLCETSGGTWNDATAVPGIVYRYWVRAAGGGLTSEPSQADTGWRAISDIFVGVTKEWDDNGNEAGYRPDSVSFTLWADGVAAATTNLSESAGWTAIWVVPKWANGHEVVYGVSEDDLPPAYDAFTVTNGCDTLVNARLGGEIWTEAGWMIFADAPLASKVWTVNGWQVFMSAPPDSVVQTSGRDRGTMFCVTNKYMRPTTPTDLSVTDWSGVYDGAEHGIGATSETAGATFLYATTESGPYSAEKPVWRDAGGPYVTWVVAEAPYFAPVTNSATVTITRCPATLRSLNATWTYDTTAHSKPEVASSGFVTGEGVTARDFPSLTDVTPAAGVPNTFAFDWNAGTRAENYELTVETGTLKVVPRRIGDDPANWDIRLGKNPTYDGTEKTSPIAQVCYVKPDGNLENIPYTLSGDKATDAGNYVLTITGTGNYAGSVTRDWAVMPRHLTLASGSATWTYDGAAHSETVVTVGGDGFAPGEGADYSGFPTPTHVADAPAPGIANAFSWAFQDGTKAGNYEVRATSGTVAVTRRAVTLTAPTKTKPYDGTPLTFGADEVSVGGEGYAPGEAFALSGFSRQTDAGQCAATFAVASGTARTEDYAITVAEGPTLTVTRSAAEIVVRAGSETWTYDGAVHSNRTWTATNLDTLVAGDELAVAFDADSVVTRPTDGPALDGIVSNLIVSVRVLRGGADGADVTANYALSWYSGTLRVMQRPVTLTSASATKPYDGTPLVAHEVAVGGDGFVGADGATFSFAGAQTEKGSSANTFSWAFKPGTNPAFYDVTAGEGTLTVTALDIGGGNGSDWTVELGPSLTYNGIEQIQTVRAATFRGLPVDFAVEDDRATDAGDYALTLVGQGNFTGRWTVPWRIAPKPLALAAGSASKVYDGAPLACGDVVATGFVAGEGAQFVCTGSRTAVGSAANEVGQILWNDGTKGSNYSVEKTAGALAVAPRAVTLTAPTKTKPYDGTPLTFGADEIEVTRTGGAPGESALPVGESFSFSDFAAITDAGQSAATFAYAAGPGTDLANYTVTVATGPTLTVTGSATEITVIANSATWTYDGATHSAPTYTTVNEDVLQPGDALVVAFADGCAVAHATDGPGRDGVVTNRIASVRVLRGGVTDVTRNYTLKSYDGTLRVTKRPVEVRIAGRRVEATYDGNEHVADGYVIETDDTLYDLADAAFSGTARAARTDAGTTPMGLVSGDFANGNADFAVTFAVTDGGVTVSPADISGGGDGDFAIALGDDPLYNGTVQTVEIRSVTWKGLPVEYALAGERATHAGSYALTVKGTGNFTGERTVRWGIRRRAVTMTSGSSDKVYDGAPLRNDAVAVSGDGFIGSEGATYDVTGSQTAAGSSENEFAYSLKAGTLPGDYDISKVFGTLTVRKATHDVSRVAWSVAADAATFLYDGAEHGVALTGLPAGVTAVHAGNVATNAGAYTATAQLVYDTDNYEPIADPAPLAWSIAKRPITLMAASKDKPYDGWPLEVKAEDITVAGSGYAPGECFAYGDYASITDVGEIPATFSYADSATAKVANYDVTVQGGQTLKVTVGGDQISVTADSGSWVYDGETHRLASWTLFNGDKLLDGHVFDIAISAASAVTTPAEGDVSNRFDHVRIVEESTGRDMTRNYNLFVYEGELRVTNAPITPCMALHRTVEATYDGQEHSAAAEAPTLLRPATVRYRVGGGAWGATAPAWTHAGDYAAEFEVSAEFYDPATGTVQVVISQRPVTLASPTKSKPFDGTPLTFAANEITAAPGGSLGELAPPFPAGESFVYSDFTTITDAGRIDAAFAWAAGPGTRAADYAVTIRNGTLTVSKSAEEIVVTAKDGTWVFDGAAHSLHEWTAENLDALAAGDALEVTFDPTSEITVSGTAENAITGVRVLRGGTDVTANYTVSWWPGTLTVTPAQIGPRMSGISTSATAVYDGQGHAATIAAPKLLTSPVTVRYAATADGPWGATPVAFKDAGAWTSFFRVEAPCYESYVGTATMTIVPREVTLVSAGATKVYDGSPLRKNEVTVGDGSLPFVAGEGFTAMCSGTVTDVGGVENVFEYALAANTKADNYTIRKEYGWLRVTPAAMDLSALAAALSWRGPYDGTPHGMRFSAPYPRAVVTFALESGNEEAYGPASPTWTNVSTNRVFFKVMAPNYDPAYGSGTVTITPRDIALAQIGTLTNEFYTGYPVEPVPDVTDTVPITPEDWTMRWEDNIDAGTARAIVCGKRNYGGEAAREFMIEYKPEIVVVIDLSNVAVGQGWWGSATLLTNGVAVPGIRPGTRTEVTVPTETDIDIAFAPDSGFRIGSVIVDHRLWTTNAVWRFPAAKADKSFDAGFLPAPQTTLKWTRGGDGRQYATISFVNHTGYADALKNLSFLFADKEWENNGTLTTNMLVGVDSRPRQPVEMRDGATYRRVDFDTSKLASAADGAVVSFGGVNLRSDNGIVRMYSAKRNLDALVGCMAWETSGKRYYQPLVGSGAILGLVAEDIVTAVAFNQALALGFDPALMATAEAKCRFTDFRIDPFTGSVSGDFEVYAETRDGYEAESSGLDQARTEIKLLGCDTLGGEWREVARAQFNPDGGMVSFLGMDPPGDEETCKFYKVAIEVDETFE